MPQERGRKTCSPQSSPYDGAMTSTVTCPHCGLAQEPPSDRVCRGCANSIAGVVAPAKSMLGLGRVVAGKALPLGARVAGVVLLINDAGRARIGAGAALSAAYLFLATAGVVQTWTGSNLAAAALLTSKGDISPAAGQLKGEKFDYCLSVPGQHWYLRAAQLATHD